MSHKDWKKEFDEKYGYEYPRCALVMKNVEVRDENEELVGYNSNGAVTPEEIKSFIENLLIERDRELLEFIEKDIKNNVSERQFAKAPGQRYYTGKIEALELIRDFITSRQ